MFTKIVVLSSLTLLIAVYLHYNSSNTNYFKYLYKLIGGGKNTEKLLTKEELKLFDGVHRKELYLSILGQVYDVTRGEKHYGPGQTYNFFVGRDASRSFVTGDFVDGETVDDVSGLNHQEVRSLKHWVDFYKKDYTKVGKLIGRYYDERGKLTAYGKHIRKLIKDAELAQKNDGLEKLKFPPCNVEWDAQRGTRVWCTKRSGGVDRNWVGVPRQMYEPGSESYRCACISKENLRMANLKEYEECDQLSESCYVRSNEPTNAHQNK